MASSPCKECGRRPKLTGRHRCAVCQLRHEPIGIQAEAAQRRLAMVPPELRVKRVKRVTSIAPDGTAWCAGCQSYRDLEDFAKDATQCRACASSKQHASMVAKVYGLAPGDYRDLLALQGGKCAICRAKPMSKRLAVDHDHKSGVVRGLLCSRCNHELLGSAWDSRAIATALWHYLNTPPAAGDWQPPEFAPPLMAEPSGAQRPPKALAPPSDLVTAHGKKGRTPKAEPVAAPIRASLLPEGWADKQAPELQAIYGELGRLLMRVDPAPF